MPVVGVVGCSEHEVEVEWKVDNHVRCGGAGGSVGYACGGSCCGY